jgi:hypothetical protein
MNDNFEEFFNKYNEKMGDKNINPGADRSFLDKKEKPTDDMIVKLFITENDRLTAVDLKDYNLNELGNPDNIKTIEGTEWILSKLVWNRDEGRIITFDIIQLTSDIEEIISGSDSLINPLADIIDINFEDVSDEEVNYHELLEDAIEDEDFIKAALLRDWLIEFKKINNKLLPLMQEALKDNDFKTYNKYIKQLIDHSNKLVNT